MSIESAKEELQKAEEHYKKVVENLPENKARRKVEKAKEKIKAEEVAELELKAKELDKEAQKASEKVDELSARRAPLVKESMDWERNKAHWFGLVQIASHKAVALRGRIKEIVSGAKVETAKVNPDNVIDESQGKGGGELKKVDVDEEDQPIVVDLKTYKVKVKKKEVE